MIKKTPSGPPSTDEDVLAQLALDHPLPKLILEYRGLSKLKSTYTDKLAEIINPQDRARAHYYSQAVAVTGRLSRSDPNLQNIPIRTAGGPAHPRRLHRTARLEDRVGRLLADRAAHHGAHLRRREPAPRVRAKARTSIARPPPKFSACRRRKSTPSSAAYAKVINFGLIYGMSAFGLARKLDIERGAAQTYVERYFARYPGVASATWTHTRDRARASGYVETVFGRTAMAARIRSGAPARRQAAERAAINAPMQGTAADLIKMAMIACRTGWRKRSSRRGSSCRSTTSSCSKCPTRSSSAIEEELPELMQRSRELEVPLVVEVGVGPNWDKAH